MPGKIVAIEHLTLDGVYQAPARPDEDTRNGFTHGGWSVPGGHPSMQQAIGAYMAGGWSLLLGNVTYRAIYEGWQVRQPDSPMTRALTQVQKFVVSHNPDQQLPWENSIMVTGDVIAEIGKIKASAEHPLIIFGSGVLVRSLIQHNLVDELLLMVHPVVLGEGLRFFNEENSVTRLKMAKNMVTDTGVVIATYQL